MKQSYRSVDDYWQCNCLRQNWIMDIEKCPTCGLSRDEALEKGRVSATLSPEAKDILHSMHEIACAINRARDETLKRRKQFNTIEKCLKTPE